MRARFRSWWQIIRKPQVAIGVVAILFAVVIGLFLIGLAVSAIYILFGFVFGLVFGLGAYWLYTSPWLWVHLSWQKTRKPLAVIGFIAVLVVVITLIILEVRFYGTGFAGKTLWDWLQLLAALAIPIVVGFGAVWFTIRESKVADAENTDNQRETALQAYIDKMSELLLHEKLRDSAEEDEVRNVARVRTLTILPRLDATRKRSLLLFLKESGLIAKDNCIINLNGADLREASLYGTDLSEASMNGVNLNDANFYRANLSGANLRKASLVGANLSRVNLSRVDLSEAYLSGADFSDANLSDGSLYKAHLEVAIFMGHRSSIGSQLFTGRADLHRVDLIEADLRGARITEEQLKEAKSLKGATMPDGSIHP